MNDTEAASIFFDMFPDFFVSFINIDVRVCLTHVFRILSDLHPIHLEILRLVKTILAIDLGAESSRISAAHFDGARLQIEELYRFPNTPVREDSALRWDIRRLWKDVQEGIEKGKRYKPVSLGVDTWAVDFGLLDEKGNLIANPVHYRDKRTDGMMEKVFSKIPKSVVFEQTGIQFMPINTLYQMVSLIESDSTDLKSALTFLTISDLLNYWLTGTKACEFTNATTTQMLNPRTQSWATDLMTPLGIPTHIFPEVVLPGTKLGEYQGIPVIAPACHDTGSAVAAVPAKTPEFAYISSGTWSLVGLEVNEPVMSPAALEANVTNEGGVYGTYRLLKNVMGLWIVQQCKGAWESIGDCFSYAELTRLAESAPPFRSFIPPNHPMFLPPGDHPKLVREFCKKSGQPIPESQGEVVRCVLESLALKYREVLEDLIALTGKQVEVLHIVGGGGQNELLCQMTANATHRPVVAGPVEATTVGNTLVQLIALGLVEDLHHARQLSATVEGLRRYTPQNKAAWDDAYGRFQELPMAANV